MESKSILNLTVNLDQYQIVENINQGGCGRIYLVQKDGQEYVAKVMIFQDFKAEDKEKMIDREIQIMMRVNHPTLIKIFGYSMKDFNQEDNPTLILEYYEKGSLYELLQSVRIASAPEDFEPEHRQIILLGIARGMQYLHEHNIIHRDLSTSNILIGDKYYPVIMDFGFSKIYQANKTNFQSSFGGTLYYMSPEVIRQDPNSGPKSDVYSFGIIMYEVVTDKIPYPDHSNGKISDFELKKKIVEANYRPKFDDEINESLRELIEQCWSQNPDDRPTFSEIFKKLMLEEYFIEGANTDEIDIYIDEIADDEEYREPVFSDNEKLRIENEKLNEIHGKVKLENDRLNNENRINLDKFNTIESEYNHLNERYNELNDLKLEYDKLSLDLAKQKNNYKNLLSHNKPINNGLTKAVNEYIKQQKINILLKAEFDKIQKELNQLKGLNCQNKLNNNDSEKEPQDEFEIDRFATFIGDHEFENNSELIVVEIPTLVKRIGISSFAFCDSLTQVILPQSINKLGPKCFYSCSSLNEIDIPPSVEFIGESAFELCKELRTISIESPTIDIEDRVFAGCSSLMSVNILNSSSIDIGKSIFDKCSSLKEVIISSSLEYIIKSLFFECSKLKEVTIPSTITNIGDFAFYKCSSLGRITIPSSVTRIGYKCFSDCYSLKQIVIPSKVRIIDAHAFAYCLSLEQVSFESPSSLVQIDKFTFTCCDSLEQITIPSSVKIIGSNAFYQCSSLKDVLFELPSSLEMIDDQSFGECSSLNKIRIPSSVISIAYNAFQECKSLMQISIPSKINEKEIGLNDLNINIIKI